MIAEETTTTRRSPRLAASWPMATGDALRAQALDVGVLGRRRSPARGSRDCAAPRRCRSCRCRRCRRNGRGRCPRDIFMRQLPPSGRQRRRPRHARRDRRGARRHPGGRPACAAAAAAASRAGSASSAAEVARRAARASSRACATIQPPPAARQHRGIGRLVLVEGAGSGTRIAGRPMTRELGDGRGAGAADDEMGCGDARRQVAEEGRRSAPTPSVRIGVARRAPYPRAGTAGRSSRRRAQRLPAASASAGGTRSDMKRAPWLPPKTSRRNGSPAAGAG